MAAGPVPAGDDAPTRYGDLRVDVFFPGLGEPNTLALEFCGRCPVRADCLADAIADPSLDFGVRGGMSASARKARRRNLATTKAAPEGRG